MTADGLRVGSLVGDDLVAGLHLVLLPTDLVTESNGLLGKKGSGKTNAGIVLLEEIWRLGVPIVTIDPKGDHWGIRADGPSGPGLPIPVFGGRHGDIPLEPTAGTYIADLVRSRRLSVVLDVSEFSGADRRRFLTAFVDRLYRHESRDPMHLLLEEAHEYIPQRVDSGDAAMVGAFERIVKQGRFKGIGVTMLSQRSASLNKNVLTQVDNLFMLRMGSPQDRTAVRAWIDTHADSTTIIDALPRLLTGECWLWQPERGEPVHFQFRMRHTYDAGETPKIGEKPRPPVTLADIDLGEISAAMTEAIARSQENDPKRLRGEIEKLRRELVKKPPTERVTVQETVEVEVRVIPEWIEPMLNEAAAAILGAHKTLSEVIMKMHADRFSAEPLPKVLPAPAPEAVGGAVRKTPPVRRRSETIDVGPSEVVGEPLRPLSNTERNVLGVLAQFPKPLTTKQLALRAGSSAKSSTYTTALASLRKMALIDGRGDIWITEHGRQLVGAGEPMPTGRALLEWWKPKLKTAEGNLLAALVDVWPDGLSSADLADIAGYSITSSTFTSGVAALRSQELIYGDRTALRADDAFGN